VRTVAERPGYASSEVWLTRGAPAPIEDDDLTASVKTVSPQDGGTILRVIEIPPEPSDPAERERSIRATFANLYKDADHRPQGSAHPGMHTTDTVDYALVLSGEIYAVMDEGETLLRAGDILIQRGTSHAWANRSSAPCRIAFILIDGRRGGK
jgi:mannose-6-phosphate isomerase-like protein (cupin superfamily)